MLFRKKIIIAVVICVIGCGIFLGAAPKIDRSTKDDMYKELGLFADALAVIQSQYIDEAKPKDLVYGALKGMLTALDPYSEFLSPEEFKGLKEDTFGKFGGVGMEITLKDGLVTVVSPLEDSPAWKAGIQSGDRIVKIDDKIIKNYTLSDAVKLLRGNPGTKLKLVIWRQKEKKLAEFEIIRSIIKIQDIKNTRIIEPGIGYVRLVEFSEGSSKELAKALEDLKSKGMKALILDVRYNPGGLLTIASDVTEQFLDKDKVIVTTKGRGDSQTLEFRSRKASEFSMLPLVVLVNEGSASGSEILAGALQDHHRAIIIGEKTFGKGSVQTVIPMADGSAMKLTTSKYFTPSGRSIHGEGIKPDIEIKSDFFGELTTKEKEKEKEKIAEEFPDDISALMEQDKNVTEDDFTKRYKRDNQLIRAVDVVKGLLIYNQTQAH